MFGDGEKIAPHHPLVRAPTLVPASSDALIEGSAILDHLERTAAPDRAMVPVAEPGRRRALQLTSLGLGMTEKGGRLFSE